MPRPTAKPLGKPNGFAQAPQGTAYRLFGPPAALKTLRKQSGLYLAALIATDVTKLTSLLFIDADKTLLAHIGYPKVGEGMYILKDILSRKKQLMPTILELIKKAREK